jgi:PAS domain S-box-containing protein
MSPTVQVVASAGRSYCPSQANLEIALRAAKAGMWEWNLSTNENLWSEEVWHLYGLEQHAHPPCYASWLHSVHPDDRLAAQATIEKATLTREPIELEWRTNPQLGPVRWLMSRGQPTGDGQNNASSYIGIVMDITARKEAEAVVQGLNMNLEERVQQRNQALIEHERLLQNLLDGVPGLVGYWTSDRINLFANRAYGEWFGTHGRQITGMHLRDLLGPELYRKNLPHIEGALRGERQRFERDFPIPGDPGKYRAVETHYIPDVVDGMVRGFLVMVFDISAIKQSEQQAEAASQAKSDFLASISHELRTPLNAIFGLAQLGAREAATMPAPQLFQQILESGQHLLSLVNDVLDLSKIEAGKLQLDPTDVDLGQLIEHLVVMTHWRAQAKGLNFVIDELPGLPRHILADATRLSQILLNLVTNAIKFTDTGSVSVKLGMQDRCLCVEVNDTGVGIDAPDMVRLFKPFEQVTCAQLRNAGGTGLGLAISQRLAALMGGAIDVESQPGAGSTFTLRVPVDGTRPTLGSSLTPLVLSPLVAARASSSLRAGLTALQVQVIRLDQADPELPPPRAILLAEHEHALVKHASIQHWLQQGARLLVWTQLLTPVDDPTQQQGPSALAWPPHSAFIRGPMSPLRLLHALERQAGTSTRDVTRKRLQGLCVLAAEDNPINRLVLEQMLVQEGAAVSFAENGEQALELIRQQGARRFDAVLCDIQMPVMDGYETAEALHRLAPSLPVIGLTAHAFASARRKARSAGMVDFITKPYMLDTLVDVMLSHTRPHDTPAAPTSMAEHIETQAPMSSDWQSMLEEFAKRPGLLDKLLAQMRQTLPESIAQIEHACRARDIAELARLAHDIKGLALNLRAGELSALAICAQDSARQDQADAIDNGRMLALGLRQFLAHAGPGVTASQ